MIHGTGGRERSRYRNQDNLFSCEQVVGGHGTGTGVGQERRPTRTVSFELAPDPWVLTTSGSLRDTCEADHSISVWNGGCIPDTTAAGLPPGIQEDSIMRNSCALRPVILVFVFALVQASAIADSNLVLSKTTLPAGQTTTISA